MANGRIKSKAYNANSTYIMGAAGVFLIIAIGMCAVFNFGKSTVLEDPGLYRTHYWAPVQEITSIAARGLLGSVASQQETLASRTGPYSWFEEQVQLAFFVYEPPTGSYTLPFLRIAGRVAIFHFVIVSGVLFLCRNPVVIAWRSSGGRAKSVAKLYACSLLYLPLTLFALMLLWIVYLQVYEIDKFRQATVTLIGGVPQISLQGTQPILLSTAARIAMLAGAMLLYLTAVYQRAKKCAYAESEYFGYCEHCGYALDPECHSPCPECGNGISEVVLSRLLSVAIDRPRLLIFLLVFMLFTFPIWYIRIAPLVSASIRNWIEW